MLSSLIGARLIFLIIETIARSAEVVSDQRTLTPSSKKLLQRCDADQVACIVINES